MDYYHLKSDEVFFVSQKALIAQDNQLLILRASDSTNLWELPGGLLEMDEEMPTGLLREVAEETGLAVTVGAISSVWDHHLDAFTFRDGRTMAVRLMLMAYHCTPLSFAIALSAEHDAFHWLEESEFPQYHFAVSSEQAIQTFFRQFQ